jgi:arylsulfatase A
LSGDREQVAYKDCTSLMPTVPNQQCPQLSLGKLKWLLVLIWSGTAWPHACAAETKKPDIVIILADDLGYGDPHCFNTRSKIPTPNIDRLASAGMRFTDAHAAGPLCHPSRYGLVTGRFPFRTDVSRWPRHPLIEKGQVTIASLLRQEGYHTAMVGKWHLGFEEHGYEQPLRGGPVDCGFDTFFGLRASTDIPPFFYIRGTQAVRPPTEHIEEHHSAGWSPIQGAFWRGGGIAPGFELADVLPRLTAEACAVLGAQARRNEAGRQPLLLYLALTAPHTPWLPAAEFAGKSGAGLYGDFAMMVDAEIGRVLDALDQTEMAKDTLLIFASDNGPVWYPADVARFGHDAAGGLRGMKSDLWEAGHRMPFIVRWPGHVKAGTVSEQIICFTDLLATFADVCGVKLPARAGPDSFSILPVLEGRQPKGQPIRGPIVMRAGSSSAMMIRDGDWTLINQLGSGGFSKPRVIEPGPGDPKGQLYNLRDDLAETNNLYLKRPEIVARLEAEMSRIIKARHSR